MNYSNKLNKNSSRVNAIGWLSYRHDEEKRGNMENKKVYVTIYDESTGEYYTVECSNSDVAYETECGCC